MISLIIFSNNSSDIRFVSLGGLVAYGHILQEALHVLIVCICIMEGNGWGFFLIGYSNSLLKNKIHRNLAEMI